MKMQLSWISEENSRFWVQNPMCDFFGTVFDTVLYFFLIFFFNPSSNPTLSVWEKHYKNTIKHYKNTIKNTIKTL